jgi:ribosomal protein S9
VFVLEIFKKLLMKKGNIMINGRKQRIYLRMVLEFDIEDLKRQYSKEETLDAYIKPESETI